MRSQRIYTLAIQRNKIRVKVEKQLRKLEKKGEQGSVRLNIAVSIFLSTLMAAGAASFFLAGNPLVGAIFVVLASGLGLSAYHHKRVNAEIDAGLRKLKDSNNNNNILRSAIIGLIVFAQAPSYLRFSTPALAAGTEIAPTVATAYPIVKFVILGAVLLAGLPYLPLPP